LKGRLPREPDSPSSAKAVVPVQDPSDHPSPIGLAFEWVGRIFVVVIEMVVPGLIGQRLDAYLGTKFLVLVGFGGGFCFALWHLLLMTRPRRK
jgi:hypothetical protein